MVASVVMSRLTDCAEGVKGEECRHHIVHQQRCEETQRQYEAALQFIAAEQLVTSLDTEQQVAYPAEEEESTAVRLLTIIVRQAQSRVERPESALEVRDIAQQCEASACRHDNADGLPRPGNPSCWWDHQPRDRSHLPPHAAL